MKFPQAFTRLRRTRPRKSGGQRHNKPYAAHMWSYDYQSVGKGGMDISPMRWPVVSVNINQALRGECQSNLTM